MEFSNTDQIEFFDDKVIHHCAGGFVFFEEGQTNILYVALLQNKEGHFVIPKGHLKINENPEQTAIREIKEELNLLVDLQIIAKIGIDNYAYDILEDERKHHKNVHLYVYRSLKKEKMIPLGKENFVIAEWVEFSDALERITFDRENLLKAREIYINKKYG